MSAVPNYIPKTTPADARLAVIGEAPGTSESVTGTPFVGASGSLLRSLINKAGIPDTQVMYGNICQYRPPGDEFQKFEWSSPFVQEGLATLKKDIELFNPNCVLLLGNIPLKAAVEPEVNNYNFSRTVSTWRGTIFRVTNPNSPFHGRKAIASFHPAAVLRNYPWKYPLFWDIAKAVKESRSPELNLPHRNIRIITTISQLLEEVEAIKTQKCPISVDIEGGPNEGISCIGIATSPTDAWVVEIEGRGKPVEWTATVLEQLASILSDPTIPKILQNSLYDNFCLSWCFKLPILGLQDDTMLKHWELYCEMEKSLAFQASIYTREPYYKFERKSDDYQTFLTYCGKDAAVTYEINEVLERTLKPQPSRYGHYKFNMRVLRPLLYMELRGFRFDSEKAKARMEALDKECEELQKFVDSEVQRLSDGKIQSLNIRSPAQMKGFLYGTLKLPKHFSKEGSLTADTTTLMELAAEYQLPVLQAIVKLRAIRARQNLINLPPGSDGRIRCSYNVVGTETGRVTSSKSPTGSGGNLQTVPEEDRDLYLADDGMEVFQVDLSGADGWTVAAHSAALGFPNMLEDLKNGIKIPKRLAFAVKYGLEELKKLSSVADLKAALGKIEKSDPLYFCAKQTQHGSNYGMKPRKICELVFVASEGKITLSETEAKRLQEFYFTLYPGVLYWHRMAEQRLLSGQLACPSGHVRVFLDRLKDVSTLRQYLAHEPQANTTYVTNRALLWLWENPANRRPDGSLIVEPLHHVHDAIVGQWPIDMREKAIQIVKEAFSQPITIAGIQVTIPFEGRYGPNWKVESGGF